MSAAEIMAVALLEAAEKEEQRRAENEGEE
jgi:hypothetical protein